MMGLLVLHETIVGITDPSTTRKAFNPAHAQAVVDPGTGEVAHAAGAAGVQPTLTGATIGSEDVGIGVQRAAGLLLRLDRRRDALQPGGCPVHRRLADRGDFPVCRWITASRR